MNVTEELRRLLDERRVKWASDGMDRVPHYCPNCGRRVEP